jgi:hypothetical protein
MCSTAEALVLGNKIVAIGAVIFLVSILTTALAAETYLTFQSINPAAAIAAVAVAIIGIAWLKKTAKL